MAFTSYSDLQSEVASWLHRSDLTTEIKSFICLAEADLRVRAKLAQWDASDTLSVVSGVSALPADFYSAKTCVYGTQSGALQFLPESQFNDYLAANPTGDPLVFCIRGTNVHVAPAATGSMVMQYVATFTPLSDTATFNSLLDKFPDVYLNGSLMHACSWTHDTENMAKYAGMFEAGIKRIRTYMLDYKYPQGLQMRAS